jgi:hypothetical protein
MTAVVRPGTHDGAWPSASFGTTSWKGIMTVQTDTTSTPPRRVRAGSAQAVLAVVPYLLGFMPESSLVVIGTEPPNGTVKVTLRYDLPGPSPEDAEDIAGHAFAVLDSQQLTTAFAIGYGPAQLVTPLASALTHTAAESGIELTDVLRVEDSRYWSYSCQNPDCCPPEGTPFDPGSHPAAAIMATGRQVLGGRDELAASIAPVTGEAAASMRQATRRAGQHASRTITRLARSGRLGAARKAVADQGLAAVAEMIAAYRDGSRYASDYQLAWLTVALKDLRVRDDAWARMDPGHCEAHLRLWTDVVRRAQPGHVAAPASLLAFVAWQAGNGALANVALDRALADDSRYSMADLLRQVISAGAPPSMARLPMTPEEVAACYDAPDLGVDDEDLDDGHDEDDLEEEEAEPDGGAEREHELQAGRSPGGITA